MSTLDHPLVRDYLARVDAVATAALPGDVRADLRADICAHLTDELAECDGSEAAVRRILDRLGAPEDVVAEAAGLRPAAPEGYAGHGIDAPFAPRTPKPGSRPRLEEVALLCLVGSVVLFVSVALSPVGIVLWIAGLVLMAVSSRWSGADKVLAAAAFGVLGIPFIVAVTSAPFLDWSHSCSGGTGAEGGPSGTCTSGPAAWVPWVMWPAGAALLALWAWAALRLWRHAHRPTAPPAPGGLSMS